MGSRSSSRTESESRTETLNLGVSESDGAIAAVDSTIRVEQTDQGTVAAARDIALDSIGATERNFDVLADTLSRGTRDAFAFGEESLIAVTGATRGAIDFARDTQVSALDIVDDTTGRAFDLVGDYTREVRAAYEGAGAFAERIGQDFLGSVERFQARESGNEDARLESVTRYALIGAAVVAVAALVWANK